METNNQKFDDSEAKTNAHTPSRRITRSTNAHHAEESLEAKQCIQANTTQDTTSSSFQCIQADEETHTVKNKEELQRHLFDTFPGRHTQIKELLNLIGGPQDFMTPLLIYGGPSCGKTSVVVETFKYLGRPYAYAGCRSCHNPRLLFESLLNKLYAHKRTKLNNYASAKRCDKIADFVQYLKEACNEIIEKFSHKKVGHRHKFHDTGFKDSHKGLMGSPSRDVHKVKDSGLKASPHKDARKSLEKGSQDSGFKGSPKKNVGIGVRDSGFENLGSDPNNKGIKGLVSNGVVYLIFDNIELLHEWTNGFGLISALFKLADLTRMPNLGLIFISNVTPDSFYLQTGTLEPLTVYFRDYTDEELHQILLKGQPNPELYGSFLNAIMKPFSRACRRVTELSAALEPLFQKYCEPINKEAVSPNDEKGKRRLFALLQPHITPALNQICNVPTYSGFSKSGADKARRKLIPKRSGCYEATEELDFYLTVCGKYLLISAFIASRNPATLDATLFDSTGGLESRKRKRKSSASAMQKKEYEEQEKVLKGPGSFPLERLLAIFQCITVATGEDVESQQCTDTSPNDEGSMELMSDALMQLSTLCNINLLYKGSSCPLEGAARYRCNIDQDLALRVARSVNFPLSKYLYR
ncbi:hypothetical protein SUGI_0853150 [Cryptomeria japonica]|uniref:origin of replication complex subunit 5 n=1 Tax=Cryptomeria japonica TaxID=3369 RepID=UPI00241493F4|nr:origin of replication complex subunit 5 [Cryptomeria japonica]GLJ41213.1 hypothetical protein SUGI_0853150 [Cryptomeria japonica]